MALSLGTDFLTPPDADPTLPDGSNQGDAAAYAGDPTQGGFVDSTPGAVAQAGDDFTDSSRRAAPPDATTTTLPGSSAPSPSPYDIVGQATGANGPQPTPGGNSPYDIVAAGLDSAPATPPGQTGRPLTVEERLFQDQNPNGGSFTNPQAGAQIAGNGRPLTVEEQNAQRPMPTGGTLSASGTLPGSGGVTTGPGGSNWQDAFTKKEGYYDPRWNNPDSIVQELQRGGNANWQQAQDMAGLDPRIAALVESIKAIGPDQYFSSQNSNAWRVDQGRVIDQRLASGELGKNQTAIANVIAQREAPIASPVDNYHAYSTQGLRDSLVNALQGMGASNFTQQVDPYGNLTLNYTSRSGQPAQPIVESLTNYANALEVLKSRAAQEQAATASANPAGGGYPRGGVGRPGGGGAGGGNAPVVGNAGAPGQINPATLAEYNGFPGLQQAYKNSPSFDNVNVQQAAGGGIQPTPTGGITNYGNTNFMGTPPTGFAGSGAVPTQPQYPLGSAGNPGLAANGSYPPDIAARSYPTNTPAVSYPMVDGQPVLPGSGERRPGQPF